jgi:ribosomal protein S18 acetylase RimI-like enzyme
MAALSPINFLGETSSLERKYRAIQLNLQAFHQRLAEADGEPRVSQHGDLSWTASDFVIPSENSLEDSRKIDEIMDWYRDRRPPRGAIFWYLNCLPPSSLEARLFARGLAPNWRAHWMWCSPRRLEHQPKCQGIEVRISTPEDSNILDKDKCAALMALARIQPRRVFHILALRQELCIGSCILNVTTGEYGIASLFDVSVLPDERRKGVGSALVRFACDLARECGCNHVALNATNDGELLYRRVGFESIGLSPTWYLKASVAKRRRPAEGQIRFLEAIGLGDIETLDKISSGLKHEQLQNPTLNKLTPIQIAVQLKQPRSGSWLLDRDVVPDIISLWDLDFKERVPDLLVRHPELTRQKSGPWKATPLHVAIERDDLDLVKLLLTADNDFDSKDGVFHQTPLGWARHFKRTEMIAMLESCAGTGTSDSVSNRPTLDTI